VKPPSKKFHFGANSDSACKHAGGTGQFEPSREFYEAADARLGGIARPRPILLRQKVPRDFPKAGPGGQRVQRPKRSDQAGKADIRGCASKCSGSLECDDVPQRRDLWGDRWGGSQPELNARERFAQVLVRDVDPQRAGAVPDRDMIGTTPPSYHAFQARLEIGAQQR